MKRFLSALAVLPVEDGEGGLPTTPVRPPEVTFDEEARFHTSGMKLALVAGVHPAADNRDWTAVARVGPPTRLLKAARLYPFTLQGSFAAFLDGERLHLRLKLDDNWSFFRSRVLVEGPWERPEAVTRTCGGGREG